MVARAYRPRRIKDTAREELMMTEEEKKQLIKEIVDEVMEMMYKKHPELRDKDNSE